MTDKQRSSEWASAICKVLFRIPQKNVDQISINELLALLSGHNTPEFNRAYLTALLDIFETYGAIVVTRGDGPEAVAATSEIAECFIRSFGLSMKQGFEIINTWHQRREELDVFWSGALLREMEEKRLNECNRKKVEREVVRDLTFAQIIVKADNLELGEPTYLFKLSKAWGEYNMVGGRLKEEVDRGDLRATARRELIDDLGISAFEVRPLPDTGPVEVRQISKRMGAYTRYIFNLFHLCKVDISDRIKLNPEGDYSWCTKREILSGKARDGKRITVSPQMQEILKSSLDTLARSVPYPVGQQLRLVQRIRQRLTLPLILTIISIIVGIIGIIVKILLR